MEWYKKCLIALAKPFGLLPVILDFFALLKEKAGEGLGWLHGLNLATLTIKKPLRQGRVIPREVNDREVVR